LAGPQDKTIFRTPQDIWSDIRVINIWAPEMHKYKDKYYLFLTFDTRNSFQEQWRGWYPRVMLQLELDISWNFVTLCDF
jgi:GH43 family beta-xylosidase